MCIEFFVVISDGSLYFCGISDDISFVFFIVSIYFFSLTLVFFFTNLASGLSILLIFSKKQLFDFLKDFCVSISFSSALSYFLSYASF